MLCTALMDKLPCSGEPFDGMRKNAHYLDWITAITFLVIGLLGIIGTLPMPCGISWAFFGSGLTLTTLLVLNKIQIKRHHH